MSVYLRGIIPQNGHTAASMRFVNHFLKLTVSWQHNALMSEGVERFVEEFLPIIRANNPQVKYVLHRTHTNCDPFVVGEYVFLRKRKRRCCYKVAEQVLALVEEMAIGGDFLPGRKHGVKTIFARGNMLWQSETKGHDVFKVYSKWKADPPDPNELTSMTHPHLVMRKF